VALALKDKWIWDFWLAREGADWHIYFLMADRSLGDPERRHRNVTQGHAVSRDLSEWRFLGQCFAPAATPAWDDWTTWTGSVVRDDAGLWHLYVTAQVPGERGHGVAGHATSRDLEGWEIGPPLSEPTGRFDQLEVISLAEVEGRWVLVFSCLATEMPGARAQAGGVWAVPVEGPGAPFDVRDAVRLTNEGLYVGKLVALRDGTTRFLAFRNRDREGRFRGGVIDPVPVRWCPDGRGLELVGLPAHWRP
jgi:beta-fructofuranosidase